MSGKRLQAQVDESFVVDAEGAARAHRGSAGLSGAEYQARQRRLIESNPRTPASQLPALLDIFDRRAASFKRTEDEQIKTKVAAAIKAGALVESRAVSRAITGVVSPHIARVQDQDQPPSSARPLRYIPAPSSSVTFDEHGRRSNIIDADQQASHDLYLDTVSTYGSANQQRALGARSAAAPSSSSLSSSSVSNAASDNYLDHRDASGNLHLAVEPRLRVINSFALALYDYKQGGLTVGVFQSDIDYQFDDEDTLAPPDTAELQRVIRTYPEYRRAVAHYAKLNPAQPWTITAELEKFNIAAKHAQVSAEDFIEQDFADAIRVRGEEYTQEYAKKVVVDRFGRGHSNRIKGDPSSGYKAFVRAQAESAAIVVSASQDSYQASVRSSSTPSPPPHSTLAPVVNPLLAAQLVVPHIGDIRQLAATRLSADAANINAASRILQIDRGAPFEQILSAFHEKYSKKLGPRFSIDAAIIVQSTIWAFTNLFIAARSDLWEENSTGPRHRSLNDGDLRRALEYYTHRPTPDGPIDIAKLYTTLRNDPRLWHEPSPAHRSADQGLIAALRDTLIDLELSAEFDISFAFDPTFPCDQYSDLTSSE